MICELCRQSVMEEAVESFGHLLTVRRRLLGLSITTMCSRSGLGHEYITLVERDALINITIPNMLRLSNAYGIDFQEMCELYAEQNEAYERGFEIERHERFREANAKRKAEKEEARTREEARLLKRTQMDNGRPPGQIGLAANFTKNLNQAKKSEPKPPLGEGDVG